MPVPRRKKVEQTPKTSARKSFCIVIEESDKPIRLPRQAPMPAATEEKGFSGADVLKICGQIVSYQKFCDLRERRQWRSRNRTPIPQGDAQVIPEKVFYARCFGSQKNGFFRYQELIERKSKRR